AYPRLFNPRHRESDAFKSERALENHIARQRGRDLDAQPVILRIGNSIERQNFSSSVDVSLDYVPTEAAIGAHRKFKIDQRAGLDSRKRCALPGFFGKVRNKGFGRDLDSRETDAADGDGVALLQFLRYLSRCHAEAALAASVGNALDFPNLFNDACEHGPPNTHMISRRGHSAFSQKTGWTLPWDLMAHVLWQFRSSY